MNAAEYKHQIFQELIPVENTKTLQEVYKMVKNFLADSVSKKTKKKKTAKEVEPESFEEWNKQFTDNRDLSEFIPEYGMTLGEYRREIYEAEMCEEIDVAEFLEEIKRW